MDDPDATVPMSDSTPQGDVEKAAGKRFAKSVDKGLYDTVDPGSRGDWRQWEPPSVEDLQKALPQYEVQMFLARGGMGAVYKGIQRSLRRTVAIKVLPPDIDDGRQHFAERFKREAQAMARLTHPNIVTVHDAGEAAHGLLYFVMEFVDGLDLRQVIATSGRLDPQRAMNITTAVCDALALAHGAGIIHRDIKPSNIMLDKRGRVMVADFGLVKTVQTQNSELTRSNVMMGTPDFVAPEALVTGAPVDERADLYALGVMLYQMLTGNIPRGRFAMPSEINPQLDRRLDVIVDKAMQADPEKRFSTALEMKTDVELVARENTPARRGDGAPSSDSERSPNTVAETKAVNRRRLVVALFIAAAAIGGTATWLGIVPGQRSGWHFLLEEAKPLMPFRESEGWTILPPMPASLVHPEVFTDMGVRARLKFKGSGRRENLVQLRMTGADSYVFRVNPEGTCSIDYMKPVPEETGSGGRPKRDAITLVSSKISNPLQEGDEYKLEFYAIGSRLIGRLNDAIVCQTEDERLGDGVAGFFGSGLVRDVAVISLDGMPEEEKLKFVSP